MVIKRGAVLWMFFCLLSGCSGSDSPPMTASSQPVSDQPAEQPAPAPAPDPEPTPAPEPPPAPPPATTPPPPAAGPAGPWPVADLTTYGSAQSLTGDVIDAGPDDAQNMWVVTPDALFVMRPGHTAFRRFTADDGLHVQSFTDPYGQPAVTRITAMAGGHANEVFVGYYGFESEDRVADIDDPRRPLGQADKVTLNADGSIAVRRYVFICDVGSSWCLENRSVRRMLFAHQGTAAGHLFVGGDHGVTHIHNDTFGDHLHVQVWYHYPGIPSPTLKVGEQYGLFVLPNGDLLSGSAYGVGLVQWNPDPRAWVTEGRFRWAFTTYGLAEPFNTGPHSLDQAAGYRENQRGVAMTPDGTFWFASLTRGLASVTSRTIGATGNFVTTYTNVPGLPASGLIDLAADPDGTLWIVDNNGRLLRFDPATLTVRVWPGVSNVRRIVMDTTVMPRALYVSMGVNGLAVIRAD